MTDHQFLILKTLLDNKGRHIGENNLKDLLKDRISHKDFWDAFSPMFNNDFFTEDVLSNLSVSPLGFNAFNKENDSRIQATKDEAKKREKLHHDAKISKFTSRLLWPTFILALVGGGNAVFDISSKLIESKNNSTETASDTMTTTTTDSLNFKSGYSEVNGLKMYYEIYGQGKPLVLIHGGGSTIQTSFGRVIPLLAKNRQVIAVEIQAHGRTSDRNADLSFEQDADDVAVLLKNLNIAKADFFGFSNGGTTALHIAIRHPEIVNKLVLGSALAKRNGAPDQFWDFMKQARLENMPEQLKEGYRQVAPDPNGLQVMHDRDAKRMVNFKDIPDQQISSIKAPTLIIIGSQDMITPEHAMEMNKLIANSQMAVIPGGHGDYIGEITTLKPGQTESNLVIPLIENFLNKKEEEK